MTDTLKREIFNEAEPMPHAVDIRYNRLDLYLQSLSRKIQGNSKANRGYLNFTTALIHLSSMMRTPCGRSVNIRACGAKRVGKAWITAACGTTVIHALPTLIHPSPTLRRERNVNDKKFFNNNSFFYLLKIQSGCYVKLSSITTRYTM